MKRVRITEQQLANLVATKTEEVEKVNKTTEKVGGDNLVVIWPNRSSQTQYTGHLEGIKGLDTCQTGEACYMCPGPPPHMSIKPCPSKNTMREENYPDENGNMKGYGSIEGKFEPQQGMDAEYMFNNLEEVEGGNQRITQSADRPDEDIPSKKKRMRGMAKELNKLAKPKPEGRPGGKVVNENKLGGVCTCKKCGAQATVIDRQACEMWISKHNEAQHDGRMTRDDFEIDGIDLSGVRRHDREMSRRRPYSSKARDMRGSRMKR